MGRLITIPNILTLIRFIVSPIMLPVLLVYLSPMNNLWINAGMASFFLLFSITDFFDGFLARKYNQVSAFGKVLDPIADKCLVYSVLIALLAINKIYFVWVIFLIVRDFFMMGIRQTALEHGFSVPVSFLGKLKTFVQMAFLAFLILNPYHLMVNGGIAEWVADFWRYPRWMAVEAALLGATLILALFSGYLYYREFIQKFNKHDGDRQNQLEI